jgi:hypothetical protein
MQLIYLGVALGSVAQIAHAAFLPVAAIRSGKAMFYSHPIDMTMG